MMVVVMGLANPFVFSLLLGGRLSSGLLVIKLFFSILIGLSLFGLKIFIIIIIILWLPLLLVLIVFGGLLSILILEDIILTIVLLRCVMREISSNLILESSVVVVDFIVLIINVLLTKSIISKHGLAKIHQTNSEGLRFLFGWGSFGSLSGSSLWLFGGDWFLDRSCGLFFFLGSFLVMLL